MTTKQQPIVGVIAFIFLAIGVTAGLMALYLFPHYFLMIPYDVPQVITQWRLYFQDVFVLEHWQANLVVWFTLLAIACLAGIVTSILSYRIQKQTEARAVSIGFIVLVSLFVISLLSLWYLLS